jgi:hypothetical protein
VTQTPPPPYGPPPYAPAPSRPNHPSAVPALVLGILSIVMCGLFTGIPAIVVGRRATREIRADRSRYDGESLAQAGFWTGVVGTALSAVGVVFLVGIFVMGGVVHTQFEHSCARIAGHSQGYHPHRVEQRCP